MNNFDSIINAIEVLSETTEANYCAMWDSMEELTAVAHTARGRQALHRLIVAMESALSGLKTTLAAPATS